MKNKPTKDPVQVRALDLAKRLLNFGSPEARYILRTLETRAKAAQGRQEKKERRALDPKAPARKELAELVAKADAEFSRYIRLRDTKVGPDGVRRGHCVTCGALHAMTEFDCGHWIPRKHWSVRWNERNAAAQDAGCNRWQHGKPAEFEAAIRAKYGQGTIDHLLYLKKFGNPPRRQEILAIIETYKLQADLRESKGEAPSGARVKDPLPGDSQRGIL